MKTQISPVYLRTFRKAYEVGNFTLAAKELAMTQSGVSQHIAILEDILGTFLFERVGRVIQPTKTAEKFYTVGGAWLSQMDEMIEEIRTGKEELRGRLVFGAPGSFAHFMLPSLIKWQKKHPDLLLDIVYGPNSVMAREISSGRMDLGVTTDPLDAREFVNEEIFEQEYVLVSHPSVDVKMDSWESFCQNRFIDYPGCESIFQKWIGTHFRKGLGKTHRLNLKFRINNMDGNLILLQQNAGITIYPTEPIKQLVQQGKLKIHTTGKKVSDSIYLIQRQGQVLSKKATSLRELILLTTEKRK